MAKAGAEDTINPEAAVRVIGAGRAETRVAPARARLVNAYAPRAVLLPIIKEGYPAHRYLARTAAPA